MHQTNVTRLLSQIESGDPSAADQLLPLVYGELRKLAAASLAREKPGVTLQATDLVHEAYLRLVDRRDPVNWESRGHFFAAAAEAIRRILIEKARRKLRLRHGGNRQEVSLQDNLQGREPEITARLDSVDLLALSDALDALGAASPRRAQLVRLRYFAGCTLPEVARMLGISQSTAEADWTYAKAWLKRQMDES